MTQDARDLLARFDSATTAVGDRISRLLAATAGLPSDFKDAMSAIADHLQALGTDPANPTPVLPPA